MTTFGGNTPHLSRGIQTDFQKLYFSAPEIALKIPVTLQAGYGVIKGGQAMALNLSAGLGNRGKLVPYNPTVFPAASRAKEPGRAYLLADGAATATTVTVSPADTYKFAVGDDLIINDDTTAAENLGAITAINHDTGVITFTAAIGATPFDVANDGYVCVEAGTSTNLYSDCVGLLEFSLDTGSGEYAQGANGVLLIQNAILYNGLLTNVDSAAVTALGLTTWGQFAIL